jgi:hypothetical protein
VGAAVDPVRRELRELQTEVAELRATVDRMEKRMARSKPVKLDPSQIELIVEALVLAWPVAAPATPARGRSAASRRVDGDDAAPARVRKVRSTVKASPATTTTGTARKARAATTKAATGSKAAAKTVKASRSAKRPRKDPEAAPARRPYRSLV